MREASWGFRTASSTGAAVLSRSGVEHAPTSWVNGAATYDGRSLLAVALLGAKCDHQPTFLACGASAATELAGRFLVTNLSIGRDRQLLKACCREHLCTTERLKGMRRF